MILTEDESCQNGRNTTLPFEAQSDYAVVAQNVHPELYNAPTSIKHHARIRAAGMDWSASVVPEKNLVLQLSRSFVTSISSSTCFEKSNDNSVLAVQSQL